MTRPPLYFEDVEVGSTFTTLRRTITEADIVNFAGVSGDFNPLHMDAEFAKESIFGQRVAHGVLVLGIATGLRQGIGLFDGTLMGLLEFRTWRFLAPVFIGDTVRVETEIVELRPTSKPDRGVMTQRISVLKQDDTVVQQGELVALLKRREPA
jgi:acyl dehydratase